jgi:hypothetical protein
MRVKKIALLMVPVLVLLCASVAVAGNVVDYTYDGDGNIGDAVITAQTPTVHISADPETIQEGASSTLSWTSDNATSCSIDQGIGTVPLSGSTTVSPAETTTYTITATGPGGTSTDSVTVTVAPPPEPTVTISADPETIQEGASSTLSWTSDNATSCSIDQGIGTVPLSGSTTVSPAETTTYTITATGPGGTATDSVTVTVTPTPTPQTITLRPHATGDHTGISYQSPATGAHYDKVDEVTADGTTYVYTYNSVEEYDLYGIPDHTTENGTINYVKLFYRVCVSTQCYGYFKPTIKTGGTVYYGTQTIRTTIGWITYNYTWTANPQTGVAWTWDDIDALQIGIAMRVLGGYYDTAGCTQVYVEVNYTPSQ